MAEDSKKQPKVYKKVGPGEEALPPTGEARREELKRRADALEAEMATILDEIEMMGIDPSKLDSSNIDREVRNASDPLTGAMKVTNADPNYVYGWVFRDPGNRIGSSLGWKLKALGWEVVCGDMKEAWEHRAVTGERWLLDCLLMRCRIDHWAKIQMIDKRRRLRQQEGITAKMLDAADKRNTKVRDVSSDERLQALIGARSGISVHKRIPSSRQMRKEFVRQTAKELFAERARRGTLPGLEIPGIRR